MLPVLTSRMAQPALSCILQTSFGSEGEEGRNVDSPSHQVNGLQCVINVILENPCLVTTLKVFSFCFLIIWGSHFLTRLRR